MLLATAAHAEGHEAIDTEHLRLELTVDPASGSIRGRAIQTLRLRAPAEAIELDAVGLEVRSVRDRDGNALAFEQGPRTLRIRLGQTLSAGSVSLAIDYVATPRRGVYFVGPGPQRPKLPRQVWTKNSWPEDARTWFPCHDDLNDKTTSELLLTLPRDWQAMANGALVETRPMGRVRTWHWKTETPHSTYLLAFVAGEYEEVQELGARVPLSYFVYRGRAEDARKSFGRTGEMLRFFEAETGFPYPYPKYAQSVAADFGFGGMENLSAVTLGDAALLGPKARLDTSSDSLIAHELAHQWWGDTVTPRAWADLWLSEGFATYFAELWHEHALGEDAASYARLLSADAWFKLEPEQRGRSVVASAADPNALLDANVYQKGSLVLGLLRHMLGADVFRRGIQGFIGHFAFKNAGTDDLEAAMEQTAGLDLGWFFDQWLRRPGAPELTVAWRWDAEGGRALVSVRQAAGPEGAMPPFLLPVEVRLLSADGATRVERIFVERAEQEFSIPAPDAPRSLVFDTGSRVLKTLRFEKPAPELVFELRHGAPAVDRAVAARALGAAGGEAALVALAEALQKDRFWGVRAEAASAAAVAGGAGAVAALRVAAADPDSRVREAAIRALGTTPGPEVGAFLLTTVATDPSERVQAEALRSLGSVRVEGAYEALTRALGRESHADRIRIAALEGLGRLGDRRAVPVALEQAAAGRPPTSRAAAIGALRDLGRGQGVVLGRLQRLLDDPQAPVRSAAAEAIGAIGGEASLAALRAAAGREDVPSVRRAIEKAASRLTANRT